MSSDADDVYWWWRRNKYGLWLMVCFVPSICLSIRKSCQRCDCSELGTVRNWVDHCIAIESFSHVRLYDTKILKLVLPVKIFRRRKWPDTIRSRTFWLAFEPLNLYWCTCNPAFCKSFYLVPRRETTIVKLAVWPLPVSPVYPGVYISAI